MTSPLKGRFRKVAALFATAALGLSLAACSGDNSDSDSGNNGDSGDKGTITLGYIPSWTDGLSMAYLLDNKLTAAGYTVKHKEINDAGVLYTALAQGTIDIYPSAWPEVTHKAYMDKYGDKIEDLDTYYEGAKLTFAVPKYSKIKSIADLPNYVDELDGTIVGIEPGAGLTKATKEQVIPAYGLDDAGFKLKESSTATMLTELSSAIDQKKEIVVTLWRPFWANSAYPVRDLEDPKDAFGDSEGLHIMARQGFSEDYPEIADWAKTVKLPDDMYGALESSVTKEHKDDPAAGVEAFLKDNPDAVADLKASDSVSD